MREVCGTVSGMFMAAGLAFSNSDNKAEQYKIVQELAKRFKDKNGSIICRELLSGIETSTSPIPSERTETYYKKRPCIELVGDSVEILEQYIEENGIPIKKGVGYCRHGCEIEVRMSIPPGKDKWEIGTSFHKGPCLAK